MDLRTPRLTAPLSLALIITMLCGIIFAAAPAADAQGSCLGRAVTVNIGAGQQPTNGHDVIMGTSGVDNINGKGGNDRICGGGGKDTINGGSGHDIIDGGGGADKIYGGSTGNDTIYGGTGNDQIWGRNGNDTIYGQGGADKIYGEAGHDVIWGGNGADILWGGSGNDQLNGEGSNDKLYGEAGADNLTGGYGTDFANGGGYTDTCDAETETNCENLQPPEWVGGSLLTLDRLGLYDFTISWGATTGGTPEVFELTITNGSGATALEVIDAQTYPDFTVTQFQGYALVAGQNYALSIVPVNAAGSGPALTLNVPIPEVVIQSDSYNAAAAPPSASTNSSAGSTCSDEPSQYRFGVRVFGVTGWIGDHYVRTDACHDGTTVTTNSLVPFECDEKGAFDLVFTSESYEPLGGATGGPQATNTYRCKVSAAFTITADIRGSIPFFADAGLAVGTDIDWDLEHVITHKVTHNGSHVVIDTDTFVSN